MAGYGIKTKSQFFLYDRLIQLKLTPKENSLTKPLLIQYRPGGVKPDITMTLTELPGNACYQVEIRLRNMSMNTKKLRDYVSMEITAGYYGVSKLQSGEFTKFSCAIYSSYVESPNPDGVTVLVGLVVGNVEGMMTAYPVTIKIQDKKVKMLDLVKQVVQRVSSGGLGGYTLNWCLDKNIQYELPTDRPAIITRSNGWAALMWLQATLFEYGYNVLHTPIFMTVFHNYITVFDLTDKVPLSKYKEIGITNVEAVTKASFTGPKLEVIAPWIPSLLPGSVFYMPATYYQAPLIPLEFLPNTIDKADLYYVIKMDVKFGTVGNTNQMHITAIPVMYAIPDPNKGLLTYDEAAIPTSTMDDLYNTYVKKPANERDSVTFITIGEGTGEEVAGNIAPDLESFWSAANSGNFQSLGGMQAFIDGIGWSQLAAKGTTPDNLSGYKEQWKFPYTKLITRYGKESYKKICKDEDTGISAMDVTIYVPMWFFWPLIALATYWKYKEAGRKGPYGTRRDSKGIEQLMIDVQNPDHIKGATTVWVPSITPEIAESGQLDKLGPALVAFGKYYIDLYKDKKDAASRARYDFGVNTYKAGICVGGWTDG